MENRIIEIALEILIMAILEKQEFKKSHLAERYAVTERTIKNHFDRINNVLADRFINVSIEYDYSTKLYSAKKNTSKK